MSGNDSNVNRPIVVPYVGIDRIIEVVQKMYKMSAKEMKLEQLCSILGTKLSNLANVTPTLASLDLGYAKNGVLTLTPDGILFGDSCNVGELEKAKQIIKNKIPHSEPLVFVKALLETRKTLSGDEIGNALAERFDKNWKSLQTRRIFGNSCASLLSFSGNGHYFDGILSLAPLTVKTMNTISAPEATYNEIMNVLKSLHGFERAKIGELSKRIGLKDQTVYSSLTICSILNLVEKGPFNTFHLIENGKKIIDPLTEEEEKKEIFKNCLLQSEYIKIINKLAASNKELTSSDIGDVLAFELERDWSEETKKLYGNKFLSWLTNSKLSEKSSPGKYKIKKITISNLEIPEKQDVKKIENSAEIFEIGRILGNLESIISEKDKTSRFKEKMLILKGFLEEYDDLKFALEMLKTNFEIALNTENPQVFTSSLSLISNKISEKLGILEKK